MHGDALAVVGGVARMTLRGVNVQTPDELAVNDKALGLFLLDQLVEYLLAAPTDKARGKAVFIGSAVSG